MQITSSNSSSDTLRNETLQCCSAMHSVNALALFGTVFVGETEKKTIYCAKCYSLILLFIGITIKNEYQISNHAYALMFRKSTLLHVGDYLIISDVLNLNFKIPHMILCILHFA